MWFSFFFFFSSRRRHTRSLRDWSSDVCSSDLETAFFPASRIEDQSLPWGKCCLPPIGQVGNFAQPQIISCQIALPPIPRVSTGSGERVAPLCCYSKAFYQESKLNAKIERTPDWCCPDGSASRTMTSSPILGQFGPTVYNKWEILIQNRKPQWTGLPCGASPSYHASWHINAILKGQQILCLFTKKLLLPPTRPLNRLRQHPNPVPPSPTSRNTSSAGSGNNASSAAKSLSSTAIPISANPLSPSISPPASPPANPCPMVPLVSRATLSSSLQKTMPLTPSNPASLPRAVTPLVFVS